MRITKLFLVIALLLSMISTGWVVKDAIAQGKASGKSEEKKEKKKEKKGKKDKSDDADELSEDKARVGKDKKGAKGKVKDDKELYKPKHVSSAELDEWVDGVPPGWSKGKKTGWKGAGAPPGQLKRQGGAEAMYPPQAREWDQKRRDEWDRRLEKSKTRIKDAASKRGGLSDADRESAIFSIEGAARRGVPIKTAEETVEHAIKRGMRGEDIEKMTRAMAYGADKNVDQNNLGKFARQEIDAGQTGDALALAIYEEIDTRHQPQSEQPQKKSSWWKRLFGG